MSVAGSFYPAEPAVLRAEVERLLAAAAQGPASKAIIAPHAGYIYSGPIAASAFRRLTGVKRVVLLGPSHFVALRGVALPAGDVYSTPLGDVPVEAPPGLRVNQAAHAREHSLEVEVPFLQCALREFTLVPLVVGDAAPQEVAGVVDALWGGPETAIVISSDLSHYLPYELAQRADAATAKEILALGRLDHGDACGAAPVNGLLAAARKRGLRAELFDLRNSGDTAGDRQRVVGYGAFGFYE
ncbi:MAG TPA: AmmeMemoRadiSam system protein B [Myxococcales bacterium]|nr:AmmeMemoRadiSam system protein B [Myxococcales bacterium]